MATALNPPENAATESMTLGVCVPKEFPKGKLRSTLRQGGYSPAFWHDSPEAAIAASRGSELELFLFGVRRPDTGVLETLGALAESCPTARTIIVYERSGDGDVRKSLDVGARALVPLTDIEQALLPVIGAVRAGQVSVPGAAGREAGRKVLTSREKQILGQVVLGMTNAEIAAKLFLAESTVKSHLSSAFAKLGVSSRNEAAALILNPTTGVGLGILTIPSEKLSAGR